MQNQKKNLRVCGKGHRFYKSSTCPVCPICESKRDSANSFLSLLGAPARRALEREGITSLQMVSKLSKNEILELHGMGPSTIPKLERALKVKGLSFVKNNTTAKKLRDK